ncbi:MAG: hypothetical protein WDO68_02185 [Gammaproteobacteria bacterium]
MALQAIAGDRVFLSAIVEHEHSPQVRTAVLTAKSFDSLLDERPAAITLGPRGVLSGDLLLGVVVDKPELFKPLMRHPSKVVRWRCYALKPGEQQFELTELMDAHSLHRKVVQLLKRVAQASTEMHACALLPDFDWTPARDRKMRSVLTQMLAHSAAGRTVTMDADPIAAPTSRTNADEEALDREKLVRIRKQMLDKVGSYSSEEIAAGAESTTSNASQYAADQRNAGKIFGVRFGQTWHYPKFQFDSRRRPYAEMRDIVTALSPDDLGWDRIQWFLEPHKMLHGKTPLQVWSTDRKKIVEAANTERWNGRD